MLRAAAALLIALTCAASAQVPTTGAGAGAQASGAACSQYTTFIARTSGTSATEQAAYQTMICGMVTDGTWSLFDALYIFATNSTTTAGLNLVSTNYTATVHGTLTFSADHGWTGNGSTGYIDTGLSATAGGINFSQNSASGLIYDLTSATSTDNQCQLGQDAGTNFDLVLCNIFASGPSLRYSVATTASPVNNISNANSQGSYLVNRTSSSTEVVYKNGSLLSTNSQTSGALSNDNFYVFNTNGDSFFTSHQLSAAGIGGGLTSTQITNVQSRLNAYMTALGINVY